MSTRCNVAIVGGEIKVMVYRHCDGWPTNLRYDLDRIVKWLKEERIPENPGSIASWLIFLGIDHMNFGTYTRNNETFEVEPKMPTRFSRPYPGTNPGLYEVTSGIHGDIDFFYVVDTLNKCWRGYGRRSFRKRGRATFDEILLWHSICRNKGAPHPDGDSFSSKTAQEFEDKILGDSY